MSYVLLLVRGIYPPSILDHLIHDIWRLRLVRALMTLEKLTSSIPPSGISPPAPSPKICAKGSALAEIALTVCAFPTSMQQWRLTESLVHCCSH